MIGYTKARKWFKSAASQGNEDAINALKNLDHQFAIKLLDESKN
jgi:TPR repeat protein